MWRQEAESPLLPPDKSLKGTCFTTISPHPPRVPKSREKRSDLPRRRCRRATCRLTVGASSGRQARGRPTATAAQYWASPSGTRRSWARSERTTGAVGTRRNRHRSRPGTGASGAGPCGQPSQSRRTRSGAWPRPVPGRRRPRSPAAVRTGLTSTWVSCAVSTFRGRSQTPGARETPATVLFSPQHSDGDNHRNASDVLAAAFGFNIFFDIWPATEAFHDRFSYVTRSRDAPSRASVAHVSLRLIRHVICAPTNTVARRSYRDALQNRANKVVSVCASRWRI